MSRYRIWFTDPRGVERTVESDRMDARSEGLYLDRDWQPAFEWNYWIPPSRLVLITKLPAASEEPSR